MKDYVSGYRRGETSPVAQVLERVAMKKAAHEVEVFLGFASQRVEKWPGALPFKQRDGAIVLCWLRSLATRYANGEDLTEL